MLGLDLKGIGVSAGSACTSGNVEPSYVLVAMGVPLEWAMGAVRHSLGRSTTAEDIDYVVECDRAARGASCGASCRSGPSGRDRMQYSPTLIDHFRNPRNAGIMRDPDGVGESEYKDCMDLARVSPARARTGG